MAKHIQKNDLTGTWNIETGGETWILDKNASITTDGTAAINIAGGDYAGTRIELKGDVTVANYVDGIYINSEDCKLVVGKDSVVEATLANSDAVYAFDGLELKNAGVIKAGSVGALVHGDFLLTNTGRIEADYAVSSADGEAFLLNAGKLIGDMTAVSFEAEGSRLINGVDGTIRGGNIGVQISGEGEVIVVNAGLIKAETAIKDVEGTLQAINWGKIVGDVLLGTGEDIFDTRKGTVDGTVFGGEGHDTFLVSSQSIDISEAFDEGLDEVKSTVSYTLGANIETLTLLGKKDLNASGNDDDNTLRGNTGDNVLKGKGGEDFLASGRGDDLMIGGTDADSFQFTGKSGHDTIKDFEDGTDAIFLTFLNSEQEIQDMIDNNATETKGGVLIEIGKASLFIKGMDLDHLGVDDFILPF